MRFIIISIIFISVIGTLLHFTYNKKNDSFLLLIISAVNESTWEHIKIALGPAIAWGIVDYIYYYGSTNYFFAKFASLFNLIVLIPLLFYTYQGIFKKDILIFDILIFYISIIVSQLMFYKIITSSILIPYLDYYSIIGLTVIYTCYLLFTIKPPKGKIFKSPV